MFTQTSTYEKRRFFLGELREKKDIAEKKCLDYYPFGMLMPGRNYQGNTKYDWGFNGKLKDNELKGEGNSYDYGMRMYDPRGVRFWSVDPIARKYPELSPYQFAGNTPIQAIDIDGKEPKQSTEPSHKTLVGVTTAIDNARSGNAQSYLSQQLTHPRANVINPGPTLSKFLGKFEGGSLFGVQGDIALKGDPTGKEAVAGAIGIASLMTVGPVALPFLINEAMKGESEKSPAAKGLEKLGVPEGKGESVIAGAELILSGRGAFKFYKELPKLAEEGAGAFVKAEVKHITEGALAGKAIHTISKESKKKEEEKK